MELSFRLSGRGLRSAGVAEEDEEQLRFGYTESKKLTTYMYPFSSVGRAAGC